MRFFLRSICAAAACAAGWCAQYFVYYLVATNASPRDRGLWSMYTGAYALGAFLVIGLPLAGMDQRPIVDRPVKFLLLGGLGGLGGAALTLLPPALFLLPVTAPLGFVGGICGMAVYRALVLAFEEWMFPKN